eukprot:scpid102301/ scgid2798/ 
MGNTTGHREAAHSAPTHSETTHSVVNLQLTAHSVVNSQRDKSQPRQLTATPTHSATIHSHTAIGCGFRTFRRTQAHCKTSSCRSAIKKRRVGTSSFSTTVDRKLWTTELLCSVPQVFVYHRLCHHPTIWKFLDGIFVEQAMVEQCVERENAGHEAPKKRRKYEDRDKRLRAILRSFETRTKDEFLRGVAANLAFHIIM